MQADRGLNQGYKLHLIFSNEIFGRPFELLDDVPAPAGAIDDESGFTAPPRFDGSAGLGAPALPSIDVAPDGDIAGIGLGVNERLDAREALALGAARTRNVAAVGDPPSTLALVVGMIALPFAAGATAVAALRRRRQALMA